MSPGEKALLLFAIFAAFTCGWTGCHYAVERRVADGCATRSEMRRFIAWARRVWGRRERL